MNTNYEKIIEDAFANIFKLAGKLNEYDSRFLVKNIKVIAAFVNSIQKEAKIRASKNNLIQVPTYDDSLDYFSALCALFGFSDIEVNLVKFEKFTKWFFFNALSNTNYKADRITKQILMSFFNSFVLFEFTYDREPNDYLELRNFLFTWENAIDEKLKSDIEKLL